MTRLLPKNKWYPRILQIITFVVILARLLSVDTILWNYLNSPEPVERLAAQLTPNTPTNLPKTTKRMPVYNTSAQTVIQKIKKLGGKAEKQDAYSTTIATVRGAEVTVKPTHPVDPTPTHQPVIANANTVQPTSVPTAAPTQAPTTAPVTPQPTAAADQPAQPEPTPTIVPSDTGVIASNGDVQPLFEEPTLTPSPEPTAEITPIAAAPQEASDSASIQ